MRRTRPGVLSVRVNRKQCASEEKARLASDCCAQPARARPQRTVPGQVFALQSCDRVNCSRRLCSANLPRLAHIGWHGLGTDTFANTASPVGKESSNGSQKEHRQDEGEKGDARVQAGDVEVVVRIEGTQAQAGSGDRAERGAAIRRAHPEEARWSEARWWRIASAKLVPLSAGRNPVSDSDRVGSGPLRRCAPRASSRSDAGGHRRSPRNTGSRQPRD